VIDTLHPSKNGMEESIYHLPVIEVRAKVDSGWWTVEVRVKPQGSFYSGKKDRSYFSAMAKSLNAAIKVMP